MKREPVLYWMVLAYSVGSLLFPHLFAKAFLGDARIVRMVALPLLALSAVILIDFYF
ncbi:hypothetical protein [Sphingomonas lenta]|uniref:hypothetical protein n=1 Tax=Sphingomonas lenta TaxID=1141887 RepID=UPI0015955030|nr:hypothetical protein [Sphingomonas lenta]